MSPPAIHPSGLGTGFGLTDGMESSVHVLRPGRQASWVRPLRAGVWGPTRRHPCCGHRSGRPPLLFVVLAIPDADALGTVPAYPLDHTVNAGAVDRFTFKSRRGGKPLRPGRQWARSRLPLYPPLPVRGLGEGYRSVAQSGAYAMPTRPGWGELMPSETGAGAEAPVRSRTVKHSQQPDRPGRTDPSQRTLAWTAPARTACPCLSVWPIAAGAVVSGRPTQGGVTRGSCGRPVQRIRLDQPDRGERRWGPPRAGARNTGGHPACIRSRYLDPDPARGTAQPPASVTGTAAPPERGRHGWSSYRDRPGRRRGEEWR
jgi:hypothetical protein